MLEHTHGLGLSVVAAAFGAHRALLAERRDYDRGLLAGVFCDAGGLDPLGMAREVAEFDWTPEALAALDESRRSALVSAAAAAGDEALALRGLRACQEPGRALLEALVDLADVGCPPSSAETLWRAAAADKALERRAWSEMRRAVGLAPSRGVNGQPYRPAGTPREHRPRRRPTARAPDGGEDGPPDPPPAPELGDEPGGRAVQVVPGAPRRCVHPSHLRPPHAGRRAPGHGVLGCASTKCDVRPLRKAVPPRRPAQLASTADTRSTLDAGAAS